MNKIELLARGLKRLQDRRGVMRIDIDFGTVVNVVAGLQLALKHPDMPAEPRRTLTAVVNGIIDTIERDDATVAHLLREGFQPVVGITVVDMSHD